ncbi:MAG TPA: hypothetical protein VHU91_00100, partial [Mycobacteriales bacterium]|nr:hypothetical protein [Mycobacteriales bacterium]
ASIDDIQVPINVSGNGVGATLVGDALGQGTGNGSAKAISKSASAHGSSDDVSQVNGGNPGILNGNQLSIGDIQVPVNVSGNGVGATLIGDALGLGSGDGSASAWS